MAKTSELNRVTAVVLRFTRGPLLVMIVVYAIGIIGMALMPGHDADGNPQSMSLFHAFYFFTYTATTTGFGEIPYNFTDEQRLWTILCLYMGVIAWLYAIGSIIKLLQNPFFVEAVSERRFARSVSQLHQAFYVICGFGDTGSLLTRGFSDHGLMAAVIDGNEERIKALALRDYRERMPGLCADASVPKHLVDAGITHECCLGIIALSADDDLNLKIAVMARSLNRNAHIICRSTSARHQKHLQAMENVTVINPFELFADQIRLAVNAPELYTLNDWFVGAHDCRLDKPLHVRKGPWILCGYGRMGSCIERELTAQGVETVVIDPYVDEVPDNCRVIREHGDTDTLTDAGMDEAAGLVAGTDSDAENLGILLSARRFGTDAFLIVRQNQHENEMAFSAASADLIMQASLVTARNILLRLIAPDLHHVIYYLEQSDPVLTANLVAELSEVFGDRPAHLMSFQIGSQTPAVIQLLEDRIPVTVEDLLKTPSDLKPGLECVPLALTRGNETIILPETKTSLTPGDQLLVCSTDADARRLAITLDNPRRLRYLISGYEEPSGYVFRWLTRNLPRIDRLARSLNA